MDLKYKILDSLTAMDPDISPLDDRKPVSKMEPKGVENTPQAEHDEQLKLREAQGEYEQSQQPTILDRITEGLSSTGEAIGEGAQEVGQAIGEGVEQAASFVKESPNFWRGAAPLLMGAMLGDLGAGARAGAKALRAGEKERFELEKENMRKLAGSSKPLTSSNIVEYIDPVTKKVIYGRIEDAVGKQAPQKDSFHLKQKMALKKFENSLKKVGLDFDTEQKLRKEYNADKITINTKLLGANLARMQSFADDRTGASDVAMMISYMKSLDPTSVVSPGEQLTAKKAGSIPDSVRLVFNRLISGADKTLPDGVRENFLRHAQQMYQAQLSLQDMTDNRYIDLANQYSLGSKRIIGSPRVKIEARTYPKPPKGQKEYVKRRKDGKVMVWDGKKYIVDERVEDE